jgi:hypothetical protein
MLGADLDLSIWSDLTLRALLFGESQARIVISTPDARGVLSVAASHAVPAAVIGRVRAGSDVLSLTVGAKSWRAPLQRLASAYHEAIPGIMTRTPQAIAALEQDSVAVV